MIGFRVQAEILKIPGCQGQQRLFGDSQRDRSKRQDPKEPAANNIMIVVQSYRDSKSAARNVSM